MRQPENEAWGPLNAFQKVMLQWSSLYPYNAAHVCKLAGPLRSPCLSRAVARAFERLGLGVARLSADGQSYRHARDADPAIETLEGSEWVDERLDELTGRLLNQPFDRPSMKPFRFVAVNAGPHAHRADQFSVRDCRPP